MGTFKLPCWVNPEHCVLEQSLKEKERWKYSEPGPPFQFHLLIQEIRNIDYRLTQKFSSLSFSKDKDPDRDRHPSSPPQFLGGKWKRRAELESQDFLNNIQHEKSWLRYRLNAPLPGRITYET
jgi:hypothetical protein